MAYRRPLGFLLGAALASWSLSACLRRPPELSRADAHAAATATAITAGTAAPAVTLTTATGSRVALADLWQGQSQAIVVFHRGFYCHSCVVWLSDLQRYAEPLRNRGIVVFAIATDSVADTATLQARVPGITVLTDLDPEISAIAAWGLRIGDAEHPWPGTFVVAAPTGVVRWRYIGAADGDWPTLAELAAAINRVD